SASLTINPSFCYRQRDVKRLSLVFLVGMSCWSLVRAQTDKSKQIITVQAPPPAVEYNPRVWKEFSSQEGRFSILLPGIPVAKSAKFQTSAGEATIYTFVLKLPESFYDVGYMDYPIYSDTDEFATRTLQAGRDGMLARDKGMELLGERQIVQSGFPGREY